MAVESEEILSKISDLINSKVDELSTNLNNFRQEASNNNQTLENAIGSIKSVIDEKLSKIDEISSKINSIQTSVQGVTDSVSATNNKIDNILSQQTQLQRTVDSVSQNIEKLSTVTNNQLTYLSNQSQNITEKIDKLSLQQEREARTAAVEGARGTVVVDSATGKTVSGVAAADATGTSEETKQSLIGSVLSGIKGILTSPLALGSAALGAAALGTAYALRKEPPGTPQAGSDEELNLPRDTSRDRRTSGQTGQPLTGRVMTGGATAPKNLSEDTLKALNEVARENNLDPSAISMMIDTESKWKTSTRSPSGTYRGLTQIGRQTFKEAGGRLGGLTWQQYQNASPADQIRVYGSWLKHYKFQDKLKRNDVNLSELSPNLQAAYLQGFQFAPNAESWQRQFGKGNYGVRTTRTRQARALGSTSINDMARYYGQKSKRYPPVFEKRESGVEQRPQPDASRERTQEQPRQFPPQRKLSGVNEEVTSRFNELQGFVGPLKVISGYRSPSYNRRVGGAKKSQHTSGNAIDVDVRHLSIEQRQELIKYASALGYKGIGVYANTIHLDMGSRRYWGPNYSGNSLPGWARRVIRSHMSGRFNRDDLPKQQRERQRQPDAEKQPDPNGSQPGTDKAPVTTGDILRSLIQVPEAKASQDESVFRDEEDQFIRTYYPSDADPSQYQGMDDEDYEPDRPDRPDLTGVPDYLKRFYGATVMEDPKGEDIEGRIEKKPRLSFDQKDDSWWSRRVLGSGKTGEEKFEEAALKYFGSKSLNKMDDADFTPPKTKSEREKYLDEILKRAEEAEEKAKKQAQQPQPQSQKVLGNLTGPEFFDPRTLKKLDDENTKGDDTGVKNAPPPPHKKPDLNKIYT